MGKGGLIFDQAPVISFPYTISPLLFFCIFWMNVVLICKMESPSELLHDLGYRYCTVYLHAYYLLSAYLLFFVLI